MEELIQMVAEFLYGQPRDQRVTPARVYEAFSQIPAVEIGEVLNWMRNQHLVRSTFQGESLELTPDGATAINDQCIVELVLGPEFISSRYGPATVHLIVRGRDKQEHGGSGFFSADYPGWIITAAHVIQDREIVRIENSLGHQLAAGPFKTVLASDQLDLGMIKCDQPIELSPIKIEWRPEFVRPLQEVLILGYPPYPNHQAALHHARAEVHAVTKRIGNTRDSLIISSVTRPGFSGGPILSNRGFAVGVVEQENIGDRGAGTPLIFFSATPARYCREIILDD